MERYAVVYFPNFNLSSINQFRAKYDPKHKILRPHVTLVFPFQDIPEEQIVEHLKIITEKGIKPFEIQFKGLMKSFDDYLFLLATKGKEEIIRIHNILYTGILTSQLRNDIPFIPHVTLGYFQTNNKFNENLYKQAFDEAEKLNIDIACSFNNLSLIRGNGLIPAKIVKTFIIK